MDRSTQRGHRRRPERYQDDRERYLDVRERYLDDSWSPQRSLSPARGVSPDLSIYSGVGIAPFHFYDF